MLFTGVAILGAPLLHHPWLRCRFILRLSHFFGIHRRALILGVDGCNNFCIFFASFSLDSSLPMRWWGRMYLTWIMLHTSNHGWLECTPHAIDVELDLPFPTLIAPTVLRNISLGWVAMWLIPSRSWRWSFSWIFQRCSTSTFRSCVARHLCLQNFSRPSTKYMFFCWRFSRPSPVRVSNKQNIYKS
jgi:hypothetical protein